MQRLRLYDVRQSRMPRVLGLCADNLPAIAGYTNSAVRRLLYCKEAMEEGWNGSWAEIAFNISRAHPYITLPREIARLEAADVCDVPVTLRNQYAEYLRFGNGRLPKRCLNCLPFVTQGLARNNAVTFIDMTMPPQYITAFLTDPNDVGKRVFIQGWDSNDVPIYTLDGGTNVQGVFMNLDSPFVTTPMTLNRLTGIQKDVTLGEVRYYQTNPTTGEQVWLLTMQPTETTASYRRYYFDSLPCSCCPPPAPGASCTDVRVTAIAKLDMIPVAVDTDYVLLTNLEAIIEEAQSVRYSEMDSKDAKEMAHERHLQAVRLLMGELGHYNGVDANAVNFAPFGSARLERIRISMI